MEGKANPRHTWGWWHTELSVGLGTAVTELSPGVATHLSGPVQCPSKHCWVWVGSAMDVDEDPCWVWGLLQGVGGREILDFTSSFLDMVRTEPR